MRGTRNPERLAKMKALRCEGWTLQAIANHFGIQKSAVASALNPERHRARSHVWYAVKRGKLLKPQNCQRCNSVGPLEAHHHDYYKPLEVEWLCRECHYSVPVAEQNEAERLLAAEAPKLHAEMLRYLPVLERAESNPEIWSELTEGLGIATLNGYREATKIAASRHTESEEA